MKIDNVRAVYFSPTGTTGRVVKEIGEIMACELGVPMHTVDFTLPDNRRDSISFSKTDLVVF